MGTRLERVVLELEDRFTTRMARAAASTALLNRELDGLSKDAVRTQRSMSDIDTGVTRVGRSSERSGSQIDKLSGRVRILADLAAILGPTLVPIGAVAIPALSGLAAQLGFATVGIGTTVLAFQGMGDALDALNKAELEPTTENLLAAQIAMEELSPAAREFAQGLRDLIPQARALRDAASEGFFPGALEGLDDLETVLPRIERLVSAVATELGEIAADSGESLASERWESFLDFIAAEAPEALRDLSTIIGNTGHAMAELWMAFDPINDDFSQWLVDSTEDLDRWAEGLDQTEGFREFVDYIRENGPQVADTFGSIGDAILQIVQAVSPLGGPALAGVEAVADVISGIADSDLGTPIFTAVAALALLRRGLALFDAGQGSLTNFGTRLSTAGGSLTTFSGRLAQVRADLGLLATSAQVAGARTEREILRINAASARLKANLSPLAKSGAVFGAIALTSTGAADGIGLTNAASLALLGTLAGPPGAVGLGLVGLLLDAKSASKEFGDSMKAADTAIESRKIDEMTAALERLKKERKDIGDITGVGDFFSDVSRDLFNPGAVLGFGPSAAERNEAKQKLLELNIEMTRTLTDAQAVADFGKEGFIGTAEGIDSATQSAQDLQAELVKINEILEGRASFRNYQEALDDFAAIAKTRADLLAERADAIKRAGAGEDLTAAEKNRLSKLNDRVAAADTPAERKRALRDLRAFEATQAEQASAERERAREDIARINKELEKYKATLDTTTEAGQLNQERIDAFVSEALAFSQTLDPAKAALFLDNVREEFIKATVAAGGAKDAAEEMATELGLIDSTPYRVDIEVDDNGAVLILNALEEKLRTLRQAAGNVPLAPLFAAGVLTPYGGLDGDPDTPFWSGGWTGPGLKYEPKGVVHGDEFVFSKEATHGNVPFLDEMHRRLRGYADGGYVGGRVQPFAASVSNYYGASSPAIDYGQLAQAMAALQPQGQLYGDVTVIDGYGGFRRQMEEDRQRAGLGGGRP